MTQAPVAPAKRPHRSAAQNAQRTAAAAAQASRSRPAARASAPHLPPKKGFIRVLCVQPYTHGHRMQIPPRLIKEMEGQGDFDKKDIAAAVTHYEVGKEYYIESSQAARFLRDLGPSRYRDPLTERIMRRAEKDIYFRAVELREVEDYVDREVDKIEERRQEIGQTDVNDQNVPDDEDDE